jgi:small subunit ribosomal protein S4
MARYLGPKFKIIKRLESSLPGFFYKKSQKSIDNLENIEKIKKNKSSSYQLHLKEKQKIRFHYGVLEKQLIRYSKMAFRSNKDTGLFLLYLLEKRLDNVLFRAGFFCSIRSARQSIVHGHILINNKKITIPSYIVAINDIISFSKKPNKTSNINKKIVSVPSFITVDTEKFTALINSTPIRDDIAININEQLVVEYYSGR